jgi:hypothetical protein
MPAHFKQKLQYEPHGWLCQLDFTFPHESLVPLPPNGTDNMALALMMECVVMRLPVVVL